MSGVAHWGPDLPTIAILDSDLLASAPEVGPMEKQTGIKGPGPPGGAPPAAGTGGNPVRIYQKNRQVATPDANPLAQNLNPGPI